MNFLEGKIADTRKRIAELELLIASWEKLLANKKNEQD